MEDKEKIKAAFDQIHAEDALKSGTKAYLSEHVYKKSRGLSIHFRRFAAAAACSLLVFLAGGSYLFFTPTVFISVDVNPSLELGINRFDRIVSVIGYNEDGRALADNLSIKYMDYTDALKSLLEDQDMAVYLTDDADVVLTVAGEDESQSSQILQNIESCMSQHKNVHCHTGDSEEIHSAHDAGLSFGKYQAWEILLELDADVTLEEVQDMTMTEIRDLIWKYSQEKFQEDPLSEDSEELEESETYIYEEDPVQSLHRHRHHGHSEDN